jgi:cardiolipin synthase
MPNWLNPPNMLTLLRLALVPAVLQAVLSRRHALALGLFFVAAASDGLDGALARRFQWTTAVGAYLDPIADKALFSGIFVALALAGDVPFWLVAIIFGRDLLILLACAFVLWLTPVRKFPPSFWGKLSTILQALTAAAWLARNALPLNEMDALARALVGPTAVFTVWSGIHYGWRGVRMVRTH